jgi:hypothetical protein
MATIQELALAKRQNKQALATSGTMEGMRCDIMSDSLVPDGQPNQRKVAVKWEDGEEGFYLPRQLEVVEPKTHAFIPTAQPVLVGQAQPQPVALSSAPAVVMGALPSHPDHDFYDEFRPSPVVKEMHIARQAMLGSDLNSTEYLMEWWNKRDESGFSKPLALVGDTQAGKTMEVERLAFAIAERMGLSKPVPVFTVMGSNGVTDHDLFGTTRTDPMTGQPVFMRGTVQMACEAPVAILYLDEVNAMGGNVTSALHPIIDGRHKFTNLRLPVRTEAGYSPMTINVSKGLWVIASWNPAYAGMNKTNEAFTARFKVLEWNYDSALEDHIIGSPALRMLADQLRNLRSKRILNTPVGITDLKDIKWEAHKFGAKVALDSFLGKFISEAEKMAVSSAMTDGSIYQTLQLEVNS